MTETIGIAAGQIWECLSDKNEMTIAALKKDLNLKGDTAGLALGWLAREDKIDFIQKGKTVKVSLK